MSTLIKNTLYRFKTARAPKKASKKALVKGFIFPPTLDSNYNPYTSPFLTVVMEADPKARKQALNQRAADFTALTTLDGFEDLLLNASHWLTAEKRTAEEITQYIDVSNRPQYLTLLSNDQKNILFENLYYQIVTNRSPYLREEIINMLVMDFLADWAYGNFKDFQDNYKDFPRVVVPKELFGLASLTPSSRINTAAIDEEIRIHSERVVLQNQIGQIDTVVNEIKAFQKSHAKFSAGQRLEYDRKFKSDTNDAYGKATKKTRTVTNPLTNDVRTFVDYDGLNLPEYNYTPVGELAYFLDQAKTDSVAKDVVDKVRTLAQYETFDEVLNLLDEKKSELAQKIFNNNNLSEKQVSVGGSLISAKPVPSVAGYYTVNDFSYPVLANTPSNIDSGNRVLQLLLFGVPANVVVESASYTVHYDGGTLLGSSFKSSPSSGNLFAIDIFRTETFDIPEDFFTLTGEFIVKEGASETRHKIRIDTGNGAVVTAVTTPTQAGPGEIAANLGLKEGMTDTSVTAPQHSVNMLLAKMGSTVKSVTGRGTFSYLLLDKSGEEAPDNTGGTENPKDHSGSGNASISYIPSGYGIKRMGIADYRKVEQEVCCYVPGEVSHIENVMAREYKEKSTRHLRRQEDTTTTSSEMEKESMTDNTSTSRFEMNQEISSVLSEQQSFSVGAEIKWNGAVSGSVNSDFAENTSSQNSDTLALSEAKEITERAMERVVRKVREERVSKIVDEYEENNKHGYDNRKGDKHVSGVYRWVDKIYKNRIVNYGKRLIYEFMIPEPATFHTMAITANNTSPTAEILIKPIDPRVGDGNNTLPSAGSLTATNYMLWAAQYNAEVDAMPEATISVGAAFKAAYNQETKLGQVEASSGNGSITIPDGYYATKAHGKFEAVSDGDNSGGYLLSLKIGNAYGTPISSHTKNGTVTISDTSIKAYVNEVPVSYTLGNFAAGDITATVDCVLSAKALKQWQNDTFNAIISAYEDRLKEYYDKVAAQKANQAQKLKSNPLFYRQIENTVLRKNCIEYLIGQVNLNGDGLVTGSNLKDTKASYESQALETYAARVKFIEEAFEWNIMSYFFYPFYWADRDNWQSLYNVEESDDPIFRAFLQSGMARVMLTVKPGFEEAVNWYMSTGQIWNGGQVPTIDDPLFVSIVEELRTPEGTVEGEWESRVPTTLTVIQAGTIGLDVEGLPCDPECDDYVKHDSEGNVVLDDNGNPVSTNPIKTPADPVVMGNITNELEDVTATLETLQEDIDQIKEALNIPD